MPALYEREPTTPALPTISIVCPGSSGAKPSVTSHSAISDRSVFVNVRLACGTRLLSHTLTSSAITSTSPSDHVTSVTGPSHTY
ncbi:hypothetical protein [Streptomyces coeruleorubidus]|uniref:hypothetical protein n=1 Tax=Streptomyces coeruleorubidus TaxID=116188 RepID=UPI003799D422